MGSFIRGGVLLIMLVGTIHNSAPLLAQRPAGYGTSFGRPPLDWSGEWQAISSDNPEIHRGRGPYNRLTLKLTEVQHTNSPSWMHMVYDGFLLQHDTLIVRTHKPCHRDDLRFENFTYSFLYQVKLTSSWFRASSGELTLQAYSGRGTNLSPVPRPYSLNHIAGLYRVSDDVLRHRPEAPDKGRLNLGTGSAPGVDITTIPPGMGFEEPCFASAFSGWDHGTYFFERVASQPGELGVRGTIRGRLRSAVPTLTTNEYAVQSADLTLFAQTERFRERDVGESEESYRSYVAVWKAGRKVLNRTRISPEHDGEFSFSDVPLLLLSPGPDPTWRAALFSIDVSGAYTDEDYMSPDGVVDPSRTQALYFAEKTVENLLPDRHTIIELRPLEAIGQKQVLAEALSSSNYYAEIEDQVLSYLSAIKSGQLAATESRVEGIRRAIWAERAVRDGGILAEQLIQIALESFGTLLGDLYGDLLDFTRADINAGKAELARVDNRMEELKLSPQYAAQFKLSPGDLPPPGNWVAGTLKAARWSETMETIKKLVEALKPLVEAGMRQAGHDEQTVGRAGLLFQQVLLSVAGTIQSRTLAGATQDTVKLLISESVQGMAPLVYDDLTKTLYSYTRHTQGVLKFSLNQMKEWSRADEQQYRRDRAEALVAMNQLNQEATLLLRTLIYAQFAATALDLIQNTFGTLGAVFPNAKGVELAAQLSKYAANMATVEAALVYAFARAPILIDRAAHRAFGAQPGVRQQAGAMTVSVQSAAGRFQSQPTSGTNLIASLNEIRSALQNDDLGGVLNLLFEGSYSRRQTSYNRDLRAFQTHASGIQSRGSLDAVALLGRLRDLAAVLDLRAMESESAARRVLMRALDFEYNGSSDPVYMAERSLAIALIADYTQAIRDMDAYTSNLASLLGDAEFLPTIAVDFEGQRSELTGFDYISREDEAFELKAKVRNLTRARLENLVVELSFDSPQLSFQNSKTQVIASLAANDGAARSGEHEAEVVWRVIYKGNLRHQLVIADAAIQNSGAWTTSSAAFVVPVVPEESGGPSELPGDGRIWPEETIVFLTAQSRVFMAELGAADNGSSMWTASSDNRALVQVTPEFPAATSGGFLTIETSRHFPLDQRKPAEARVRAVNLADGAARVFRVIVGSSFGSAVQIEGKVEGIRLVWAPVAGRVYQVEYSHDLADWHPAANGRIRAFGAEPLSWTAPASEASQASARYYRLQALP
jgi:hypothetical protein